MANSAKIRTMQDDIDEAKKNLEEQIKLQQKPKTPDAAEESMKKQPLQPKSIQSDQFSSRQTADSRARQLEKNSVASPEENRKPVFISPEKSTEQFSKKINAAENNELKNLIKRISEETDEDPYDKDPAKKEVNKKDSLQTEKNDAGAGKIAGKDKNKTEAIIEKTLQEVVDDLAGKNGAKEKSGEEKITRKSAEEMEALEKDLDKIEAEEKIRERGAASRHIKEMGALEKNTKEMEDLKKMIGRISKSPDAEKKTGAKIDNIEEAKKNIQENDNIKPLAQQYKQNIQQSSRLMEAQKIEGEPASVSPDKNKSFWKNVLEQIKKTSKSKKINDLKNENLIPKIKTDKKGDFEKYSEQSGILRNNNQRKKEPSKKNLSAKAYDENYAPPAERLGWGKQEFYSSVIKKVKPREEKGEMESLKNAAMIKNRQILSKDEEYKKLKYSIAKKYHINLFSLPWKKIISAAVIALAITGAVSYFIFSRINPPSSPIATPPIIVGNEIEKFSSLEKEIIISKKDLQGFNNLESEAFNIFNSDNNIKVIKLLAINNEEEKNILSLPEALDSIGIINIKGNINYLPDGFLQAAANNYNIFIFKTNKGTIRYGLAIKANNRDSLFGVMQAWEKEKAKNKKMSAVFKPLFVNDKNFEETLSPFSASFYKNIEIRYVHLVNKDTALNYFFYEDILIFTTSKDTAFAMIDFLAPSN